jgi:hypothetical protein
MQKGELVIHAHNKVDPSRAKIGASDEGKMNPSNLAFG